MDILLPGNNVFAFLAGLGRSGQHPAFFLNRSKYLVKKCPFNIDIVDFRIGTWNNENSLGFFQTSFDFDFSQENFDRVVIHYLCRHRLLGLVDGSRIGFDVGCRWFSGWLFILLRKCGNADPDEENPGFAEFF